METDLAKPEWGLKRSCLSCGARFYDMQRDPIICPSCEAEFDPLALVRPRRARAAASQAKAKAEEKAAGSEETAPKDEELLVDDNDDDALEVDDDINLGDDGDEDLLADDSENAGIDDDPDVSEALENAKDDHGDREN